MRPKSVTEPGWEILFFYRKIKEDYGRSLIGIGDFPTLRFEYHMICNNQLHTRKRVTVLRQLIGFRDQIQKVDPLLKSFSVLLAECYFVKGAVVLQYINVY